MTNIPWEVRLQAENVMVPTKGIKVTQHVYTVPKSQPGYAPYKIIEASTKCSTTSHVWLVN